MYIRERKADLCPSLSIKLRVSSAQICVCHIFTRTRNLSTLVESMHCYCRRYDTTR